MSDSWDDFYFDLDLAEEDRHEDYFVDQEEDL